MSAVYQAEYLPSVRALWSAHVARRKEMFNRRIVPEACAVEIVPEPPRKIADARCACCRPTPLVMPGIFKRSDLLRIVAHEFCQRVSDLRGPEKTKAFVRPRWVAMYLLRTVMKLSYP